MLKSPGSLFAKLHSKRESCPKARNSVPQNFRNRIADVHVFDRCLTERCKPFLLDEYSRQVRNTTVQVWTIGEGFGIGSEFSQTCCAANNFRDHGVTSPSIPFLYPTRPTLCESGPIFSRFNLGFGADQYRIHTAGGSRSKE